MNSKSFVQKHIESMGTMNAVQRSIDSMSVMSSVQKHIESMGAMSAVQRSIDSMSVMSSVQKHIESMGVMSAVQRSIDSMSVMSSVQKHIESMGAMSAVQNHMDSIGIRSITRPVLESLKNNEAFKNSIASLAQPIFLTEAIGVFDARVLEGGSSCFLEDMDLDVKTIEERLQGIESSKGLKKFKESFQRIPVSYQLIIIFIFMEIFMPQINNIASDFISPHIQNYYSSPSDDKRVKIKEIKMVAEKIKVDTYGLRFITGKNVRLRSAPNRSSEILDELQFGKVVNVLSNKKNWIEIEYNYGDEEIFRGWVFTRYTSRFKN